ncbi:MAG: hypothetical protein PHS14_19405 [Elusimicrobia bacterium]|nr:hypothetical protein [Elusimicrobiota bacterium]
MAFQSRKPDIPGNAPIVAICRTRQEAVHAATQLHLAGFDLRDLSIVANDYPSPEAAAKIKRWPALRPAWVTVGCLNAIGAGLDSLRLPTDALDRCKTALAANRILVVARGTREEIIRARRAWRGWELTRAGL